MKKLLFVDHAFHTATASSQFFIDLLRTRFEVTVLNIAPPADLPSEALDVARGADVVVVWQMDYLAPVFLALGLPTVVIPMYDGSAHQTDLHWIWSQQAQFVNFSFTLHHRIRSVGGRSRLVKYFKPPAPESQTATFADGLKVFLWQRRPEHGINAPAVKHLLGSQMRALHVHDAPDEPQLDTKKYRVASTPDCAVTRTTWFPKAADYQTALSQCNVFIAPRRAEGIGMAMLEAMSRGMLVIAADEPTHNEYLSNWTNGILYNPDAEGSISIRHAERMGAAAHATVREGHALWKQQAVSVLELIDACPAPHPTEIDDIPSFASALSKAYYGGQAIYTDFMLRHSKLISDMSGVDLAGKLDANGKVSDRSTKTPEAERRAPWLTGGRIPVSPLQFSDHVRDGEVAHVDGVAWVVGHELSAAFHIDPFAELLGGLRLRLHLPHSGGAAQTVLISLNGWTLGVTSLDSAGATVTYDIPAHVLSGDNLLRLQATSLGEVAGIGRAVSVGLSEIAFS